MKNSILMIVLLALAVTAGNAMDSKKKAKKSPQVTITGYLVDVHCAKMLMGKNDVAIPAKMHARSECLMPEGVASGYGVFVVVNKSATHASDVDFYTLNAAGNKMAKDLLDNSKKKDDMLVTVAGSAVLSVENITEVK